MTIADSSLRSRQAGGGRAGFLLTLAVFGAAVFAAVKIVPVRVNAYQFRETLREEARFAAVHGTEEKEDREVRDRIFEEARELKIPLDKDDLTIRRTAKEVVITAAFDQPIDLKVTQYTYRFRSEERAPIF